MKRVYRNVVNAKKDDQDREKAENIRKTAMERIGQTKKKKGRGRGDSEH